MLVGFAASSRTLRHALLFIYKLVGKHFKMTIKNIIYILVLCLFSCKSEQESRVNLEQIKGRSFDIIAESISDTMSVEFNDSTYNVIGSNSRPLPYRIARYKKSDFLILQNGILAISKINENDFEGIFISEKDYKIKLLERKPKWNKKALLGKWYLKKYYNKKKNEIPPPPFGQNEDKAPWPPYYEISEDSIQLNLYEISASAIQVNQTAEYINMQLTNSILGTEDQWRIKKLTDSMMIINRKIRRLNQKFEFESNYSEDIHLIKKRFANKVYKK
jgi:hypothetical protein